MVPVVTVWLKPACTQAVQTTATYNAVRMHFIVNSKKLRVNGLCGWIYGAASRPCVAPAELYRKKAVLQ
jgi:hypothetical protein